MNNDLIDCKNDEHTHIIETKGCIFVIFIPPPGGGRALMMTDLEKKT